jgi:hypothetical protein
VDAFLGLDTDEALGVDPKNPPYNGILNWTSLPRK